MSLFPNTLLQEKEAAEFAAAAEQTERDSMVTYAGEEKIGNTPKQQSGCVKIPTAIDIDTCKQKHNHRLAASNFWTYLVSSKIDLNQLEERSIFTKAFQEIKDLERKTGQIWKTSTSKFLFTLGKMKNGKTLTAIERTGYEHAGINIATPSAKKYTKEPASDKFKGTFCELSTWTEDQVVAFFIERCNLLADGVHAGCVNCATLEMLLKEQNAEKTFTTSVLDGGFGLSKLQFRGRLRNEIISIKSWHD